MFEKLFVPAWVAQLARHSEVSTELCAVAFATGLVALLVAALMWVFADTIEDLRKQPGPNRLFNALLGLCAASWAFAAALAVLDVGVSHGRESLDYSAYQGTYYALLVPVTIRYTLLLAAVVLLVLGRKPRAVKVNGATGRQTVVIPRSYLLAMAATLIIMVFAI